MLWIRVCFLSLANVYLCEVKTPNIFLVCMPCLCDMQRSSSGSGKSFQSREVGTVPSRQLLRFPFDFSPCLRCYPHNPSLVLHAVRYRSHKSVYVCLSLGACSFSLRLFVAMRQRHPLLLLLDKKEATYALLYSHFHRRTRI
jgi:hypothetical protein